MDKSGFGWWKYSAPFYKYINALKVCHEFIEECRHCYALCPNHRTLSIFIEKILFGYNLVTHIKYTNIISVDYHCDIFNI